MPSWIQGDEPALFLLKREPEHEEQKISLRPFWKNTIRPPPKCRIGCPAQQERCLNSRSFPFNLKDRKFTHASDLVSKEMSLERL